MQREKKIEYQWTDADQKHHVKSMKNGLAELLKSDTDYNVLVNSSDDEHGRPIALLLIFVAALRDEIVAWCEGAGEAARPNDSK